MKRSVRLTASGAVYFLLALGLVLAAINDNNNLMYLLAFLMVGAGLASLPLAWMALGGIAAQCEPQRWFAGSEGQLHCHVRRGEAALPPLLLHARQGRRRLTGVLASAGAGDDLHERTLRLDLGSGRRGPVRLQRLAIGTVWPLGLWRALAQVQPQLELLVCPAPQGSLPLPAATLHPQARQATQDEGFSHLRDYREGDPPSRIDWRALARGGLRALPRVKAFDGGFGGRTLRLDWAQAAGDDEARLSQLARWVLEADRLGWRYALVLPGAAMPEGSGPGQLQACLDVLALYGHAPEREVVA